ncbi:MAG TPA: gephyrin-like molybdotransferase Glp [Candidatus Margulisiibacteriota bacterium]|nr:gephyrin-like molybdotransferase Glp [Candidatus Margulisiibacteriota bacterium]
MPRTRQARTLGGPAAGIPSLARRRSSPPASRSDRLRDATSARLDGAATKAFFRVVTTDEARARIAAFDTIGIETIRVADARHRVLARDLVAAVDLPHFHRANMDGYAVRAQDTFGASASIPAYLKLVGAVEMGQEAKRPLRKGEAMRIPTGGMLPPGADAVVMIEYTEEVGDGTVEAHRSVAPWENVLRIGEDIAEGAPIFARGRRLRARDLGALTGVGITRVTVFRRPRVALVSTGDEIVPPTAPLRPGRVRNINAYSLIAMATEAGAVVTDFGVVRDQRSAMERVLARALSRHDAVLISGGSSVGAKDITLDVITSLPRSEIIFHGISVAPGKPTILARALDKPVLGLPGHPQSALVIFDLFGAPLLRVLGGEDPHVVFNAQRTVRARLSQNIASQAGREDYVRVTVADRDGQRIAAPMAGKSGAIFNLVKADGLVRIPASAEGLEAGTEVEVILF